MSVLQYVLDRGTREQRVERERRGGRENVCVFVFACLGGERWGIGGK